MNFIPGSQRRAFIAMASFVLFLVGAMALPATAHAADNRDIVSVQSFSPFMAPLQRQIVFSAVRYVYNPADPVELTVTEAPDGSSVTITVTSAAAGGFAAAAPCYKKTADTAVCPTIYALSSVVTQVKVNVPLGDNDILIDTPSLAVIAALGGGNDTVSVPRCVRSTISGGAGDDTIYGGAGADTIYGDGGSDTIHVYTDPAAPDAVSCGIAAIESPSDIVFVDTADSLMNLNCLQVTKGP